MLKNTLLLHPSTSTTTTSELIYCTSPPSPNSLSPTSLSSSLSSPLSNNIPTSNNTNNHHTAVAIIGNTATISCSSNTNTNSSNSNIITSRFSFNLTNFLTTFALLFLFCCYFFSVAYHWLNLYPNSLGLPLGLKFLINQEPENVFSLIDQMQKFGRDHQKSLDFIHVFVSIPLFTCFVLGLWFDSFLSGHNHHHHYSNHHSNHSSSNILMRIGVCFVIGLQLLLSWMEKVMIMVLLEKHPFDVRIFGKNSLLRAIEDVEILNWTSKASFLLGILLVAGGLWSIHYKNNQHRQQQPDSSSLFSAPFEGLNSSSQKGSNFSLSFSANTIFRRSSNAHQQFKDIL